jgi:hypothetical protein
MTQTTDLIGAGWNFPLAVNVRGGIALARHVNEIEQAIAVILSTPRGQRVMRPEFGCRIHELIFAPINASTFATAKRHVQEALARWEPRIAVLDIAIVPDTGQPACLLIAITYQVRSTYNERTLVYPFYTIPEMG